MNAIETLESLSAGDLFTEKQAKAIVRVLEGAEDRAITKEELDERLKYFATKADIADLESRLTTKMMTFSATLAAVILGGVYFMLTHFKP